MTKAETEFPDIELEKDFTRITHHGHTLYADRGRGSVAHKNNGYAQACETKAEARAADGSEAVVEPKSVTATRIDGALAMIAPDMIRVDDSDGRAVRMTEHHILIEPGDGRRITVGRDGKVSIARGDGPSGKKGRKADTANLYVNALASSMQVAQGDGNVQAGSDYLGDLVQIAQGDGNVQAGGDIDATAWREAEARGLAAAMRDANHRSRIDAQAELTRCRLQGTIWLAALFLFGGVLVVAPAPTTASWRQGLPLLAVLMLMLFSTIAYHTRATQLEHRLRSPR